MTEEKLNLLLQAVNHGMINLDGVQEEMNKKEQKRILESHQYSIWENSTDSKWYTYIPDETKRYKRRLIKRKTRNELEEYIVDFYKKNETVMTLERLFPEWIEYKSLHTDSSTYIKRIIDDWKRFYANDSIVKKDLKSLDAIELDNWIHKKIKKNNLTKTSFYNMSIIIRQGLKFAKDKGYVEHNIFPGIRVNTKMFRKQKKPDDKTQVFLEGEQEKIIQEAFRDFYDNPDRTDALAVALNFQIGLRAGEIVSLKFSDIEDIKYLHIQRMEVRDYDLSDVEKPKLMGRKVVEYTKSNAGDRCVYLTHEAREIIRIIKEFNEERCWYDDDFIFLHNGKRIQEAVLNKRLEKYCRHIGISEKRIHKIRKTYISTLIDSRALNLNEIRKQAGHEDERTTLGNYCFNRKDKEHTEQALEQVLSNKKKDRKYLLRNVSLSR